MAYDPMKRILEVTRSGEARIMLSMEVDADMNDDVEEPGKQFPFKAFLRATIVLKGALCRNSLGTVLFQYNVFPAKSLHFPIDFFNTAFKKGYVGPITRP